MFVESPVKCEGFHTDFPVAHRLVYIPGLEAMHYFILIRVLQQYTRLYWLGTQSLRVRGRIVVCLCGVMV